MADEFFKTHVDPRQSLVRLSLSGQWTVEIVDDYAMAAEAAFRQLTETGTPLRKCKALIDLRQHGVQSREVAERIQGWIRLALSDGARHAVLVSDSALHRMQAQRVGALLGARFFSDEAQALDWLLNEASHELPLGT